MEFYSDFIDVLNDEEQPLAAHSFSLEDYNWGLLQADNVFLLPSTFAKRCYFFDYFLC